MAWTEKKINTECKGIDAWQSCKCSFCNTYLTTPYLYYFTNYKYCPNCGKEQGERP